MFDNTERILIIGGNSKNVGKTLLICNILNKYANDNSIIVIKFKKENINTFYISEEKALTCNTNTYKYLKHGAFKSYLVKYNKSSIREAIDTISAEIDNTTPIIIESNSIISQIENINNVVALISDDVESKASTSILLSKSNLIINVTPFFTNFVKLSNLLKKATDKIILNNNKWSIINDNIH